MPSHSPVSVSRAAQMMMQTLFRAVEIFAHFYAVVSIQADYWCMFVSYRLLLQEGIQKCYVVNTDNCQYMIYLIHGNIISFSIIISLSIILI